jgi:hypothetical protein
LLIKTNTSSYCFIANELAKQKNTDLDKLALQLQSNQVNVQVQCLMDQGCDGSLAPWAFDFEIN